MYLSDKMPTRKPLRIGMIGYGLMGRAHSNAYRRVNNFFDLEYEPVLQAVCARDQAKAREFADKWGYASIESDWHKLIERRYRRDRHLRTEQPASRHCDRRRRRWQNDPLREAA